MMKRIFRIGCALSLPAVFFTVLAAGGGTGLVEAEDENPVQADQSIDHSL